MPTFTGDNGDNIFNGGSENDTLIGNGGSDALSGGGGNDIVSGGSGADTLDGGDGEDTLYSFDVSPPFSLPYYNNAYTPPLLDTGSEVDTLVGGEGSDRLFAGYGDNVDGGGNGWTGDYLYISFLGAPSGVTVDFRQVTQVVGGGTITGVENISWVQGSNFDDSINVNSHSGSGYSDSTVVFGMGGNDQLIAGYYTGYIDGGEGNDVVDARGSQYLQSAHGGAGNDTIYMRAGLGSIAYGGDGNDTIHGYGETYGGAGDDTIILGFTYYPGRVSGDAGNDNITGADGMDDVIAGGAGADIIVGGTGNDSLASTDFSSTNPITFANDMGAEQDQLSGGEGNDRLSIGYGDSADGGAGTDTLRLSLAGYGSGITFSTSQIAGAGPNILGGGTIQNIETLEFLRGTDFSDTLVLGTQGGLLTVEAGDGDDVITSQNSSVSVQGGAGDDRFISGAAGDVWNGGAGSDTIDYKLATAGFSLTLANPGGTGSGPGGDQLTNIENVTGSGFGDTITGNSAANVLNGAGGADTLIGLGGNDTIDGGAGNDTLSGDAGHDQINGDLGNDFLDGGDGDDILVDAFGDNTLIGGAGLDQIYGGSGKDLLDGGAWGDYLNGHEGNDTLLGGAGGDNMYGEVGDDVLDGGDADDKLVGGSGADTLTGGAGEDLFHDTAANLNGDTITDFTFGDGIVISDASLAGFSYSISGNVLTYTGGSLTLGSLPAGGRMVASAAAGGGVQLTIVSNVDYDFNGDGRSDLAGRNANGDFTTWLGGPNGSMVANPNSGANPLGIDWQIRGIGDFNGDGFDDILWRQNGGEIGQWLGNSNGVFSNNGGAAANAVDNSWSVAGIADYNGDGRDDILWRHSSGEVGQWIGQPNGGFANNGGAAANVVDNSWTIVTNGDFNGDGFADVLWRHASGVFAEWQGTSTGALVNSGSVMAGATGSVVGSGDFNGDGFEDVLMRGGNGAINLWLGQASGQFTTFTPANQVLDLNWKIAGIADYNGDGKDDLIWRHTFGQAVEWLATGTGEFANNGAISTVDPSWQIQSPDIALI